MKIIYILLPCLLLLSCGGSDSSESENSEESTEENDTLTSDNDIIIDEAPPRNDWDSEKLNGNVKSVSTHSFDVDKDGNEIGMGGYDDVTIFDEAGYILEKSSNGCCGAANEKIMYKRDSQGNLTHRIFKVVDAWDEITDDTPFDHKEKFFYDDEGVLVKMKIAGADSVLTMEYVYKWDELGRKTKEKIEDVEEEMSWEVVYTYKEQIDRVEYKFENTENNYSREYHYGESWDVIKEKLYMADGNIQEVLL